MLSAGTALLCFLCCQIVGAEDFSVTQGYNDGIGTKTYDSGPGTLQLGSPDARWFWYLNFAKPGYYNISAQVAVSAANAGSVLHVGDYATQHNGAASSAAAALTATDPAANVNPQWQSMGQVWVPASGLRFFYAQIPASTGNPGLIHSIRVTGPGPISVDPTWTVRSAACDIYFTPSGSTRRASYAEMVSRPLPVPAISGTHTVVNMPTGYMGNNDSCFNSLWVANGQLPTPLVGFGPSRVYTHEGTGSTISFNDFNLDPTRRRKTLQISIPDGSGNTLSTFMTGEVGQRWYLGGRMRQYTSVGASSSGFLENHSVFNGHVNWRSCAWGNVWSYGSQSGGANAWWANTSIRGHLRGPSPSALPGITGVYPYGKVRQRQDMMEMIIGGLIPIAQNDTTLSSMPTTAPDLPTLNLAYNLQGPDVVNQATHANVNTAYSDPSSLTTLIRDPFSTLKFTYQKVSGPSWISVSSAGTLSGTPAAGNAGQNTLIVQATDPNAGLSGQFTVGVYVKATGGANNRPVFQYVAPEKMTVSTTDDANLIHLPVIDPDSPTRAFSILSGNGGGQFGFNGDWLVKNAALTPGATYPLTIQVADTGSPPLNSTINVTVTAVADTGGVTEEIWFLTEGTLLADFTSDPRYPDSPSQLNALADFTEPSADLSTGYRVSGYVYPPTTGSYTFYMTGSDVDGELRVSTDASPANLALQATTGGTTGTVSLTAGQRYYIEALGLNGSDYGSGSFTAQWSGPGIGKQTIPAAHLRPTTRATPKLWNGNNAPRDVVSGESYSENLRTKLDTIHLWNVLTYQKTSGPAWISISPDGFVTGTPGPGNTGINTTTVRVTAPGGHWHESNFTVNVIANSAPQFTSGTLTHPALTEGTEISGSLTTYCSDANVGTRLGIGDRITYSIVSGPAWLGVEPTGELFGKPGGPHTGLNTFTVRATDLGGFFADAQFQVNVTDIENAPVFTKNPITFANLSGDAITRSIADYAYDPDAGALTFTKLSGASWLTVASDGTLSGTPANADEGINTFTVQVTDNTSRSSTGNLTVDVRIPPFFIYDGFDATPGAGITVHSTGVGWSGNWTGTVTGTAGFTINPTSLTFGSLSVGGKSVSNGTGSSVSYSRNIGRTIQVSGVGGFPEAWISGVISLSGTAAGQGIEVRLGNTGTVFGKAVNGDLGVKVNNTWYDAVNGSGTPTGITPNGTYLFVLHLLENGTNTDITLYLGSNAAIDLSNPANFPYQVTRSVIGPLSFASLGLWVNKPDPQNVNFDEIRISNSYAEALGIVNKPIVTVTASGIPMEENSVSATFTVTRDQTDGDLTVPLTVSGSATAGTDYSALPASITIPDGVASATLIVTPVDDPFDDADETIVLSITPDAAYISGSPTSATLTIVDNDGPQPVSPPWTAQDVGSVAPGDNSSTVSPSTGLFRIIGSGTIGNATTSDGMHFVSQTVTGDCEVIARVKGQTGSTTNYRVGVAIRDGTAGNTVSAQTALRGGTRSPFFIYRTTAGVGSTTVDGITSVTTPYWVKLVRVGNNFNSFVSPDGISWSQIGATTLSNMPATTQVGIFVSSGSIIVANTATFDHVEIKQNIVSVTSPIDMAAEGNPVQNTTFTISRGLNPPSSALTLNLDLSGTAVVDSDYALAGALVSEAGTTATVTIPAGQPQIFLTATPLNDLINEGAESIVLSAPPAATYSLGVPASGATSIADAAVAVLTTNANPTEGGTTTGGGTYYTGSSQPINAIPAVGWHFVSWSGAGIENVNAPSTTVIIDTAKTVTANFAINSYTITYTAGPNGTLIGSSSQNADYGTNGTPIAAVPASGYHFANWSDGSTANPRTDTSVTSNLNVTANFAHCRVIGISMLNNKLTVNCEGTAGYSYDLERSTDLSSWTRVATNLIAPPDGKINYVEDPATAPNAFYRLKLH